MSGYQNMRHDDHLWYLVFMCGQYFMLSGIKEFCETSVNSENKENKLRLSHTLIQRISSILPFWSPIVISQIQQLHEFLPLLTANSTPTRLFTFSACRRSLTKKNTEAQVHGKYTSVSLQKKTPSVENFIPMQKKCSQKIWGFITWSFA